MIDPSGIPRNFFHSFRATDFQVYEASLANDHTRGAIFRELASYLKSWEGSSWIDDENIYFLSRNIASQTPINFHRELLEAIKHVQLHEDISKIFFDAWNHVNQNTDQKIHGQPTLEQLNKSIAGYDHSPDEKNFASLETLLSRYIEYAETSGDYWFAVSALLKMFEVVKKNPTADRLLIFHWLNEAIVRIGRVDSFDGRLWTVWIRLYRWLDSPNSAEIIAWEAFRRMPFNSYIALQLLITTRKARYKYFNRIILARDMHNKFPKNPLIAMQYYRNLGYSEKYNHKLQAIRELSKNIGLAREITHENSLLAAIIHRSSVSLDESGDLEALLDEVVNNMITKPGLIGSLGHRLLEDHKNKKLATLLYKRFARRVGNRASARELGLVAKAMAYGEDRDGLDEAINYLRAQDLPESQTHIAALLVRRASNDDVIAAESILRAVLTREPLHPYAINQLASILVGQGTESARAEATGLLAQISQENSYAFQKLEQLTSSESSSEDEEDPGRAMQISPDEAAFSVQELDLFEGAASSSPGRRRRVSQEDLWRAVPASVRFNGMLRKKQFEVQNGSVDTRRRAKVWLEEHVTRDDDQYLTFLQSVHLEQEDSDVRIGAVGAALLKAYRRNDLEKVNACVRANPRFGPTAHLIKAHFGDSRSQVYLKSLLQGFQDSISQEKIIIQRVIISNFGFDPDRAIERISKNDNNRYVGRAVEEAIVSTIQGYGIAA